jgi:hypothetical protein
MGLSICSTKCRRLDSIARAKGCDEACLTFSCPLSLWLGFSFSFRRWRPKTRRINRIKRYSWPIPSSIDKSLYPSRASWVSFLLISSLEITFHKCNHWCNSPGTGFLDERANLSLVTDTSQVFAHSSNFVDSKWNKRFVVFRQRTFRLHSLRTSSYRYRNAERCFHLFLSFYQTLLRIDQTAFWKLLFGSVVTLRGQVLLLFPLDFLRFRDSRFQSVFWSSRNAYSMHGVNRKGHDR